MSKPIDFACPNCGQGVDSGDIPDHVEGARHNGNVFDYECEGCGAIFCVMVDYQATFDVQKETVRLKAPSDDASQNEGETDANGPDAGPA
jgi:predicted RNA-binding Zn-ribbon protein involved in translation (DUF1610 family)